MPEALPPELDVLRRRVASFVRDELLPVERERGILEEADAGADLRRWVRRTADERGFFRLAQPRELGGGGLGPLGLVAVREELAASDSVLARFVLGDAGGLLVHGTSEQRERFLTPVLRGELTTAFAFTDAREGPRTVAARQGDAFVVSGVKSFVTGGPHADLLLTLARVSDEAGASLGSAIFVIRRDAAGVVLVRELRTLDGAVHGEFRFAGVKLSRDDVIGGIGDGLPRALANITELRLAAAATACGAARWALDQTIEQVARPHRTGTPLGEHEQVQAMVAASGMDLFAARAALYATARRAEAGADVEVEAAMAKVLATEAVSRIVDRAIQLTGGAAVVESHPLARLYRRIRAWRIAEGTTEIIHLTVARALLSRRRRIDE